MKILFWNLLEITVAISAALYVWTGDMQMASVALGVTILADLQLLRLEK